MVQQASRPVSGAEQLRVGCQHHWIIDAPMGPVSRGMCQVCEEVREFKNYIEAAPWGEDPPVVQPSGHNLVASSSDDAVDFEEF